LRITLAELFPVFGSKVSDVSECGWTTTWPVASGTTRSMRSWNGKSTFSFGLARSGSVQA